MSRYTLGTLFQNKIKHLWFLLKTKQKGMIILCLFTKWNTAQQIQQDKIHYVQQPLHLPTSLHDTFMMRLTQMLIDLSSGHLDAQIIDPWANITGLHGTGFVSHRTNDSISTTSNAVDCDNLINQL